MTSTVFVTGATGNIGSLVVDGLLEKGVNVRALVHNEEKAQDLRDRGVDVIVGDFTDESALARGVEGADRVFSLTPPNPDQVAQANAITAAANASSSHPHVVRLAVIKSNKSAPTRFSAQHGEIDSGLKESGLPGTCRKPHFSIQMSLFGGDTVADDGSVHPAVG